MLFCAFSCAFCCAFSAFFVPFFVHFFVLFVVLFCALFVSACAVLAVGTYAISYASMKFCDLGFRWAQGLEFKI